MELHIVIETLDPPTGHGSVGDDGDRWTFAGWLELIEKVEQIKLGTIQRDDDGVAGSENRTT